MFRLILANKICGQSTNIRNKKKVLQMPGQLSIVALFFLLSLVFLLEVL